MSGDPFEHLKHLANRAPADAQAMRTRCITMLDELLRECPNGELIIVALNVGDPSLVLTGSLSYGCIKTHAVAALSVLNSGLKNARCDCDICAAYRCRMERAREALKP